MYTVTLIDGDETGQLNQQESHNLLRKTRPSIGVDSKNLKYVIGRQKDIYLPGEICKTTDSSGKTTPDETFTVKFCNHEESSVRLDDVYPINQNYFDLVVDVLKSHQ
ncbi:uncharacterized protein LOC128228124 [Mya arenaria]|uniref:uncharacterized protein LOC128228124 n=1 Tax=Mya arenaria TaxID=6604 RepID=UPI0022E1BDDF|nr:uncharacterized protein LOC128228124 [Mya arenaria]